MSARSVADAKELSEGATFIGGIVAGSYPGSPVNHEAANNVSDDDAFVAENACSPF